MAKIIVLGSSNMDMMVKTNRFPNPGETLLGGTFFMNPGGKGANQAVALARLGAKICFITKIGDDLFGSKLLNIYESEGLVTESILFDKENPTGVALITVNAQGENCIVVASGANAALSVADIKQTDFGEAEYLLLQLEIPVETIEYIAHSAREKGLKVILNPAPAKPLSVSLFENLYMITPNRTEAEMLTGIKITDEFSMRQAADILSGKGVVNVIITLGAQGVFIKEKTQYYLIPAYEVQAIDTTAAGDTFNAAICCGLSEGMSITEAAIFASKAAAISVTRLGAQASLPYRSELNTFV